MELSTNPATDARPSLRCERCGHALIDLAPEARCPECGTPVVDSRPELRPGIPWQRRLSLGSWIATLAAWLISPIGIYRRVRIDTRSTRRLLMVNVGVTCLLGVAPTAVVGLFGPANLRYETSPSTYQVVFDPFPMLALVLLIVAMPLSLAATWLSASFFAGRKSPPLPSAVPWCSAGLNTCGMVIAMFLAEIAWLVRYVTTPREVVLGTNGVASVSTSLSMAPIFLFVLCMITVAILDSIASRANRYANSLDPIP